MAAEVELFTKNARVELGAGLDGEKTMDVPAGEQELEERVEG